ncbi:hypothetical protein ID866_5531 [Astraeus odoratus]|nr:hypothetical protein ID866_5531 [Astraeus odoratus]
MTVDENTPLIPENSKTKAKTPLPKIQLSLVLLVLFAEPLSSQYIFPFINQVSLGMRSRARRKGRSALIRELGITGGDDKKIGYYAGLIESLFFVTQALTTLHWSRLSDYVGRKPILIAGLTGLCVSNMCFGLSKTFWTLVVSRCIAGAFDGNVGVMKSMIGEITDETNMARGFALIPGVFSTGASIAPLYGGALVKPYERWPELFSGSFWHRYPYVLPSMISTAVTAISLLMCVLFLHETLPSKQRKQYSRQKTTTPCPLGSLIGNENTTPMPIGTLLKTYSVMIPILNYAMLGLVDIGCFALVPLFYATPVEIGGLGFPPSTIGVCLAMFGVFNGLFQMLFAARIVDRFGEKNVFRLAVLAFFPLVTLFPIMSSVQFRYGVGPFIWALIVLQLVSFLIMELAYSVIFVFVTKASPNKYSLGTMNGLSQTTTAIARAIGPAAFTSLFAFSKGHNILGGNFVYVVLYALTCPLVFLSRLLPDLTKEGEEDRSDITEAMVPHDAA